MASFTIIIGGLCQLFAVSESAKILFLPAPVMDSHKKSMVPLADRLATKGHNVTFWMPFYTRTPLKQKHLNDIDTVITTEDRFILDNMVYKNTSGIIDLWAMRPMDSWDNFIAWKLCTDMCTALVEQHPDIITGLASEKWDMIIMDSFFSVCAYPIIEAAKVPFILQSTTLLYPHEKRNRAIPKPVTAYMMNRVDFDITRFRDRLSSTFIWDVADPLVIRMIEGYVNYKTKFAKPIDLAAFEPKGSVLMYLTPETIQFPVPRTMDTVNIGDSKCNVPTDTLPDSYLKFVEDPNSKGTIVAAFGHLVTWKEAPSYIIKSFKGAFWKLSDYRVIWQYNGPPFPNLPSHIKTTDWLPQIPLLRHHKTKVFISHMGLKSVLEGVCSRVPILAMPLFAEQQYNSLLVTKSGVGMAVDKFKLTLENFEEAIREVASNPKYKTAVVKRADMMEDKIIPVEELGVFCVEFSIRHSKHNHLWRQKAIGMGYLKYFALDIIGTALMIASLSIYAMYCLCKVVFCL